MMQQQCLAGSWEGVLGVNLGCGSYLQSGIPSSGPIELQLFSVFFIPSYPENISIYPFSQREIIIRSCPLFTEKKRKIILFPAWSCIRKTQKTKLNLKSIKTSNKERNQNAGLRPQRALLAVPWGGRHGIEETQRPGAWPGDAQPSAVVSWAARSDPEPSLHDGIHLCKLAGILGSDVFSWSHHLPLCNDVSDKN